MFLIDQVTLMSWRRKTLSCRRAVSTEWRSISTYRGRLYRAL